MSAKWMVRVKARYAQGFAEVGPSRNGAHITVRASFEHGMQGARVTAAARLTVDDAIELRRALSRAIREMRAAETKAEPIAIVKAVRR